MMRGPRDAEGQRAENAGAASSPYEAWEGDRLYRAILGAPMPAVLAERWERAARLLRTGRTADEIARHRALLARVADLEALEYAARLLHRHDLLVAETAMMVRLAETVPENLPRFVGARIGRARAIAALAAATARSAVKLAKGVALLATVRR